ncbi:bifunctional diguanylate cyclase/phosphodiesterase [Piscinibacter sp.]|uniref:bifunctional diguanylate cyclase/phosphodiesterase n=1 Tax=Piscinibacter sp. TaxID=1903157 RepID=UPI002B9AB2AA|nr:LapD/MoxY N-terminal periplasmic domain-containing protein [Albitalea sp.]HUG25132.1 LapD/MoxY N-terminal periplasmic domain-containing protein [Albitalea sp.]
MTLIRQIWLLLIGSLLLAVVGSVSVVIGSARDTLQTQLRIKNNDNAASLALALSQQGGEPRLMELLMAAQFDTGFYRAIRFTGNDGQGAFVREAEPQPSQAPGWFVALLPIESAPGVAQVSDGWRALGSVQVVSHTAFAHDDLWHGGLRSALALALVATAAALLARVVVGRIRRPLDQAVRQAQSLVDGEFVTVPEPAVPELQRLTRAMNTMVARLKLILDAQAAQVESLRRDAHADPVTGLSNRKHFMGQLAASLQGEDGPAEGGLVLLRMLDLAGMNRSLGRVSTDRMIVAVAQALQAYTQRVPGCLVGRLNGSDFALCLPRGSVALETAQAVAQALAAVLPSFGPGAVAAGAVELRHGMPMGQVMSAADAALARAESRGAFSVELAAPEGAGARDPVMLGEDAWRQHIGDALANGRVRLVGFPLIDAQRQLIHLECPLRMQLEPQGGFESAARWLPLALRGRLTAAIDQRAVELALDEIGRDGRPRCVNLSNASLADSAFVSRLRALLLDAPQPARGLWLDVHETAAVEQFATLQELARQLRPTGARVGLEHAGERLSRIERLFEAGLDYAKLDAATVQGVAGDVGRASYLKSVVAMLHGLSLTVYAEGVVDPSDARALWDIGVDGLTGPWASALRGDLVG